MKRCILGNAANQNRVFPKNVTKSGKKRRYACRKGFGSRRFKRSAANNLKKARAAQASAKLANNTKRRKLTLRAQESSDDKEALESNINQSSMGSEDDPAHIRHILNTLKDGVTKGEKKGWRFLERFPDFSILPRHKTVEQKLVYLIEYIIVSNAEARGRLWCRGPSKQFKTRQEQFDLVTVKNLNYAWGVGEQFGWNTYNECLLQAKCIERHDSNDTSC